MVLDLDLVLDLILDLDLVQDLYLVVDLDQALWSGCVADQISLGCVHLPTCWTELEQLQRSPPVCVFGHFACFADCFAPSAAAVQGLGHKWIRFRAKNTFISIGLTLISEIQKS